MVTCLAPTAKQEEQHTVTWKMFYSVFDSVKKLVPDAGRGDEVRTIEFDGETYKLVAQIGVLCPWTTEPLETDSSGNITTMTRAHAHRCAVLTAVLPPEVSLTLSESTVILLDHMAQLLSDKDMGLAEP